jgi:hypothetical protein
MNWYYEIFYQSADGQIVYCQDVDCELEAIRICAQLTQEFPEHRYYYDTVMN